MKSENLGAFRAWSAEGENGPQPRQFELSSRTLGFKRQAGGTFLGVILGVMVGLAAALGVAIYVAKVPVPFVNKNSPRTSGQDAAEAEKNKNWDPNGALRSRSSAPPSSPAVSGTVAPEPPPQLIPVPAEAAPAAVPPPAEVKPRTERPSSTASAPVSRPPAASAARQPSADPLGDLAAARAGGTPPAATAVDPFSYFVQAGAFRNSDDAEAQRARLSLMGVEARVTEREQAGRTVYRVRVGPFQNKDAADRVKDRLSGNGFDAALVRVQR